MKKYLLRLGAGVLALTLMGCGLASGLGKTSGGGAYKSITKVKEPKKIDYEDWEAKWKIREENPVSEEFIGAVNDFSYSTAAQLFGQEEGVENRNYSPLSLYYALALTAQGAGNGTEEEFLALLGTEDKQTLALECGRLFRRLYTDNEVGKLKLADSLWMQRGEKFESDFVRTAEDDFYASLFQVDFGDSGAGKAMGQWVAEQTGELLAPEFKTSPEDILAVINTVYLSDEWSDRFIEDFNTEDSFTRASGEEITCEYMNREKDSQVYYKGDGYAGTALSLKNSGSMVLILPDEGVDIQELITEEKLKEMFQNSEGSFGKVRLSLPKFRFQDGGDMMPMLKQMGLLNAFDSQRADFSDMTQKPVFVSLVKQETCIGINEDGVEAAAYTVVMLEAGAAPGEMEIYELNFNRPFLFGIISDMGVPLFLGICENPLQE